MSHHVEASGVLDLYWFKLSASAGSEATQLMSQGVLSLASTQQVPEDICGGTESQGIIRLRPEEFIRSKQAKIWLCEERALQ